MSDQKWNSIRVMEKPLSIIFLYKGGNYIKSAKIDELFESETEWKKLESAKGSSLPSNSEPFFTRAEAAAARRLLCEMGILLG